MTFFINIPILMGSSYNYNGPAGMVLNFIKDIQSNSIFLVFLTALNSYIYFQFIF